MCRGIDPHSFDPLDSPWFDEPSYLNPLPKETTMATKKAAAKKLAPCFITLIPNYWGKADTQGSSMDNARSARGGRAGLKDFDVYRAHPDTQVDGMGCFSYPHGQQPTLIRKVRKGKEQPIT